MTARDHGQRLTRKQLAAVVRRLLYALRSSAKARACLEDTRRLGASPETRPFPLSKDDFVVHGPKLRP
jgi:hypothetical protein